MHVHIFLIVISILKSLNADSETEEKRSTIWLIRCNLLLILITFAAIKCYVCSNDGCDVIEEGQTKFLEECSAGKCFVKEEQHGKFLLTLCVSKIINFSGKSILQRKFSAILFYREDVVIQAVALFLLLCVVNATQMAAIRRTPVSWNQKLPTYKLQGN